MSQEGAGGGGVHPFRGRPPQGDGYGAPKLALLRCGLVMADLRVPVRNRSIQPDYVGSISFVATHPKWHRLGHLHGTVAAYRTALDRGRVDRLMGPAASTSAHL